MGTAPQNYQTPKTNWAAGQIPTATDFNRIEGNIYAVEEGSRTIDPTQAPSGLAGTLRQFLDWFANRIQAITGKTNWYDAPDVTLAALKTFKDNVIKIKRSVVISASGWVDDTANSGLWIYDINDADITADTIVDINIRVEDLDKAIFIKSTNQSFTGKVRLYATEKPNSDIIADFKLVRAGV